MYVKQHTLQQPISLTGIGLHTGETATITFRPAPENHGVAFRRVDMPGQPQVAASLDHASEFSRSTTLKAGEAKVHTVEHVLAALSGMQVDNVLIEIDNVEVPILDGSSLPFVDAIQKAGLQEQDANREFYVIEEAVHYQDPANHVDLAAFPFDDFRATVMVDYNSQVLGIQHATLVRVEDFETEVAPSRTFCFFHELEQLKSAGLIKGGSLDNAIVIVDREATTAELTNLRQLFNHPSDLKVQTGILNNTELRYANEPARHKLLDLIGDLSLLGSPIRGQIMAARPGHLANVAFCRRVQALIKQKQIIKRYQKKSAQGIVFDINAISRILPHRFPFLLIDRIVHFDDTTIEGYKNVTLNEQFFQGHFPGNPIMPGVLQLEAMAQVGGILLLNKVPDPEKVWVYLLTIDNVRFRKPVVPGDQLYFKLELISMKRGICKMVGKGFVDEQLVCEAEMVASLVKKENGA